MRIIDYDTHFHITWEYDHWHKHNLQGVKAIGYMHGDGSFVTEAKYIVKKDKKFWYVPGSYRDQVTKLMYSHKAEMILANNIKPEQIGEVPPMAKLEIAIPWKEGVITRPYQDEGIAQGIIFKRCLIGDEQGLGKTLQSIGIMIGLQIKPIVVICPASTKLNWSREFEKFSHYRTLVLDSKMPAAMRKNWHQYVATGLVDVVIINYESIKTFMIEYYPQERTKTGKRKPWHSKDVVLKEFMSMFKGGILDESQRCKDVKTDQAKFVIMIFHTLEYRLLLSGTPIVNKPIDLFSQLGILGILNRFGGPEYYKQRYCDGGKGANNLRELNYMLRLNCFFRREKKDVAKDLPDKQRQTFLCEISNREEYDKAESDFQAWLKSKGYTEEEVANKMEGEAILKMMNLKDIAGRGKMHAVKEFVNDVLESGEKLILFCYQRSVVDDCLKLWPTAVTVTGRDDTQKRQQHIDAFQNDPKCQLIVCNHKAAGVGITLTASSRVAFIEYPWTYADCVQCEDRAHRIGQKDNVMCTYFNAQNTVDERIWEMIIEKMTIGNTVTGATDMMDNMEQVDKTLTLFNQA
jgi:SWI/SNF-related matrix-associated actin-dependent regulator 1 of chromatin subfamily A